MHLFPKAAALAAGALFTIAAGQAQAAPPPVIDLRGAGLGSFVLDDAGSARISGQVTGDPFDGSYTAVLTAADGSLPDPGVCEPGTATLDVTGAKGRYVDLVGTGDICGQWVDATYVVTHRFVGRYDVADASSRRLRGTDGWFSVILATGGRANVEAIDT